MSTALEIKAAIDALPPAERMNLVVTLNADYPVPYPAGELDPEVDSPELEAELLKSADQPSVPYSAQEMREMCQQLAAELRVR
ncbi:MAG: hypothetical protein EBS05_13005 [Proteobacteria bacterium]|nr:hypothetical protein [Pseudomonadota bacterium]